MHRPDADCILAMWRYQIDAGLVQNHICSLQVALSHDHTWMVGAAPQCSRMQLELICVSTTDALPLHGIDDWQGAKQGYLPSPPRFPGQIEYWLCKISIDLLQYTVALLARSDKDLLSAVNGLP